jgi:hypothetical protein
MLWPPTTGADRERPPPVGKPPDEAPLFFRHVPLVPPTWLPQWDGWERPKPIPPDLAGQTWTPKTFVAVSTIAGMAWNNPAQDRERLPPIGLPPDEAKPFFVRSSIPVPMAWLPTAGGDIDHRADPTLIDQRWSPAWAPQVIVQVTFSGLAAHPTPFSALQNFGRMGS